MKFLFALLVLSNSIYGSFYVTVPLLAMYEEPCETADLVSSAYFSEEVILIKQQGEWVLVATAVDHYQGWIKEGCLSGDTSYPNPNATVVRVVRSAAHLYAIPDTVKGPRLTLPFDSCLEISNSVQDLSGRWLQVVLPDGSEGYIQQGDVTFEDKKLSIIDVPTFAAKFIGLPYTWGGRSSFGYDCSGFVQMLYRQMGYLLPRDAKDQARWEGFCQVPFEEMEVGDLIFFGHSSDAIRHVGMYMADGQFIHATVSEGAPYIHISNIHDLQWQEDGRWRYRTARRLKSNSKF